MTPTQADVVGDGLLGVQVRITDHESDARGAIEVQVLRVRLAIAARDVRGQVKILDGLVHQTDRARQRVIVGAARGEVEARRQRACLGAIAVVREAGTGRQCPLLRQIPVVLEVRAVVVERAVGHRLAKALGRSAGRVRARDVVVVVGATALVVTTRAVARGVHAGRPAIALVTLGRQLDLRTIGIEVEEAILIRDHERHARTRGDTEQRGLRRRQVLGREEVALLALPVAADARVLEPTVRVAVIERQVCEVAVVVREQEVLRSTR